MATRWLLRETAALSLKENELTYQTWTFRFRSGHMIEQRNLEILDRGTYDDNRNAAEELARTWLKERQLILMQDQRFLTTEPLIVVSERKSLAPQPIRPEPSLRTAV